MSRPFRSALAQAAYDRAGRQVRPASYRGWTLEDEALWLLAHYPSHYRLRLGDDLQSSVDGTPEELAP